MDAPIIFEPLFMERVWGDRRLESLYGKRLPTGATIGESWEIVDRPEAQSVVHDGPLRGLTLHELWAQRRVEIFGDKLAAHPAERFPLLCKLLDCRERLSVQVHPPSSIAASLGGEPKTEMWFIANAAPDAEVFAGLRAGVSREDFEQALLAGQVAEKIHRLPTQTGDAIFIPSGRVHAIGAGNVIVEIQQNSDTTYRVFDWNRAGLDGQPRALHLAESMLSIDFDDHEPSLLDPQGETLAECDFFKVEKWLLEKPRPAREPGTFAIFVCVAGAGACGSANFKAGDFFLVPAAAKNLEIRPVGEGATVLRTTF